jgi:hypothetical protein
LDDVLWLLHLQTCLTDLLNLSKVTARIRMMPMMICWM